MMRLQACDPQNYAKVHRKARCPCPGCREKLTTVNTYRCKVCALEVCLKHRFPGDHNCPGRVPGEPGAPCMLDCAADLFLANTLLTS